MMNVRVSRHNSLSEAKLEGPLNGQKGASGCWMVWRCAACRAKAGSKGMASVMTAVEFHSEASNIQ